MRNTLASTSFRINKFVTSTEVSANPDIVSQERVTKRISGFTVGPINEDLSNLQLKKSKPKLAKKTTLQPVAS